MDPKNLDRWLEEMFKSALSNQAAPVNLDEDVMNVAAQGMKIMFDSFRNAGFTEAQTFNMIAIFVSAAFNGKGNRNNDQKNTTAHA